MNLAFFVSLLAIAGFGFGLWRLKIGASAQNAITAAMDGLRSMLDSELNDDAKERALRRSGLTLLASGWGIAWRFTAALGLAVVPILLADLIGLAESDTVVGLMLRLDYILGTSLFVIVVGEVMRRRLEHGSGQSSSHGQVLQYRDVDRFFHMLAFSSPAVLRACSWCEHRMISRNLPGQETPPVFVTSLARGGTTALLNALHDVPALATHTYRDMPFLTAPALWGRMTGGNRRAVSRRMRAHGDGLEIDLDSPEAFEEVVWKMFWPEKFAGRGIFPWQAGERRPKADAFLRDHMNSIVSARRTSSGQNDLPNRYCSKNNGNIARLQYLPTAFPGCSILVALRRPECHAASLLRQHRNFYQQQSEDDFVRRYMRDIGHFEFGLIHKPILFPGFDPERYSTESADYWLLCWIHAFRAVAASGSECIIVTQEKLRQTPQETMQALCRQSGVDPGELDFGSYFHSGADTAPTDNFSPQLYDEAAAIYQQLAQRAL